MPNSRHSEAIVSPSLSRITNRIRSSITELSFHGILLSAPFGPKSVTHVSGTFCYLCLGTDKVKINDFERVRKHAKIRLRADLWSESFFCLSNREAHASRHRRFLVSTALRFQSLSQPANLSSFRRGILLRLTFALLGQGFAH